MRLKKLTVVGLLCLVSLSGCRNWLASLVATRIVVRGRRESLRDQVLGAYEQMGGEVYMLAGVRSVDPVTGEVKPAPEMTDSKERALKARRRMEFNRDDIEWFKRERYVGESFEGRLVFLPAPEDALRRNDPWLHGLVQNVTEEENADRQTIVDRIVKTNPDVEGETGERTVWRILAQKYQQQADAGMMIERGDGTWLRKGD